MVHFSTGLDNGLVALLSWRTRSRSVVSSDWCRCCALDRPRRAREDVRDASVLDRPSCSARRASGRPGGLAVWLPRRYPGRWIRSARLVLAAAILAGWAGENVAEVVDGIWTVRYSLPLQLTDGVSLCAILALLTQGQLLIELVYFWTFSASLQAVLTPDLGSTFPSVLYFTYFVYHVGSIVAACLLVFGCRRYPRAGALWRVRVRVDARVDGDRRPWRSHHRRQLHVPGPQTRPRLAPERDGSLAGVHRLWRCRSVLPCSRSWPRSQEPYSRVIPSPRRTTSAHLRRPSHSRRDRIKAIRLACSATLPDCWI